VHVEVDERGTVAAAAADELMDLVGLPTVVSFNRPFFFGVRHEATQAMVLAGIVTCPTSGDTPPPEPSVGPGGHTGEPCTPGSGGDHRGGSGSGGGGEREMQDVDALLLA
jgi:hypothetical protein